MHLKKTALASAIFGVLAAPVQAASELESLIEILRKNGTVNKAQYDRLKAEIMANTEKMDVEKITLQEQKQFNSY